MSPPPVRTYDRFLELWKNADSLPMVELAAQERRALTHTP